MWSARQWQWTFSLPATTHPLFDSADCSQGQSGNVWFLGGTFSTTDSGGVVIGSANRTCGIPAGTALLFPLINVECSTIEGNGSIEADLRGCARLLANQIIPSSLFLRIDDKPVTNLADYRVESPLFNFGPLPAGNILQFFGLEAPAGTTSPCVSDGYLVMVKPLPVGVHTLHFGGTADLTPVGGPIFKQDIRYTLTVQPRGRY